MNQHREEELLLRHRHAGTLRAGSDGGGTHHLGHHCVLPLRSSMESCSFPKSKLFSKEFDGLSLQSHEGSAETLPRGAGCSHPTPGQLPGEDISEGSKAFRCLAMLRALLAEGVTQHFISVGIFLNDFL